MGYGKELHINMITLLLNDFLIVVLNLVAAFFFLTIVTTKEKFEQRNGAEKNAVYCIGQTSVSQYANLCSVPLNSILRRNYVWD